MVSLLTSAIRHIAGAPGRTVQYGSARCSKVADSSDAPVLRDQGPDRPAGHGKADHSRDHLHAIYSPAASSRPIRLWSCVASCPLVTVVDRE
jgi:hypothetical protein